MQIANIMTKKVVTIKPDTTVQEIIQLMRRHHITMLPVVKDGELLGAVAESDLLLKEAPLHVPAYISFLDSIICLESLQHLEESVRKLVGNKARDLMTEPVITVLDTDTTSTAAALMGEHKLLSLPVVNEDGELVGIVSQGDIVRSLAK